jgi:hypothetical protein
MERMNTRFARRGLHLTPIDYALVATFVVQAIFAIVSISANG